MDLQKLLQPEQNTFQKYILRIDGQPKAGKSTLAYTASRQCPPPAQWDPKKPVALTDIMGIQFEPNSNMYLAQCGIVIPNMLDWSDQRLTWAALKPAIKALPAAAEQYRAAGVNTVVVDTLSSFNRFLLREIIERPAYDSDSERMKAYGLVDEAHYLLFDMLSMMDMSIIALVHLQAFQPFGEDGKNVAFAKNAEKQTAKLEANQVQGMRTTFVPEMRPKPAGRWARMADAVLVSKPEMKTVRAGVGELKYNFIAQTDGEFAAGGRWAIPAVNNSYLRPIIESRYNNNNTNNGNKT